MLELLLKLLELLPMFPSVLLQIIIHYMYSLEGKFLKKFDINMLIKGTQYQSYLSAIDKNGEKIVVYDKTDFMVKILNQKGKLLNSTNVSDRNRLKYHMGSISIHGGIMYGMCT